MTKTQTSGESARFANHKISALARWKIFDNLRRCMAPVSMLAMLVTVWLVVPSQAWIATLAAVALIFIPTIFSTFIGLINKGAKVPLSMHFKTVFKDFLWSFTQQFIALATVAFETTESLDAIARTTFRLFLSHRKLLEWQTASDAERTASTTPGGYYNEMKVSVLMTAVIAGAVAYLAPTSLPAALPLLVLWFFAPLLVWAISRPRQDPHRNFACGRHPVPAGSRAPHVALLRYFCERRRQLAAAGQFSIHAQAGRGQPHLADEHGRGAAVNHGRARLRLHLGDDTRAPAWRDIENDGRA